MNKKQVQILIKKIIPIGVILLIVIIGLLSIPLFNLMGKVQEKENEEWFSNSVNKEKIENVLNSKEILGGTNLNKQNGIRSIKGLLIDIEGWNIVNDEIDNDENAGMIMLTKDSDYFNIVYVNKISFSELPAYSEYQNEKIIRNLKEQGLLLKPIKSMERIVKGRNSLIEIYDTVFQGEKHPNMVVMSLRSKDYYFTISYPVGSENVSELFDNFSFED